MSKLEDFLLMCDFNCEAEESIMKDFCDTLISVSLRRTLVVGCRCHLQDI